MSIEYSQITTNVDALEKLSWVERHLREEAKVDPEIELDVDGITRIDFYLIENGKPGDCVCISFIADPDLEIKMPSDINPELMGRYQDLNMYQRTIICAFTDVVDSVLDVIRHNENLKADLIIKHYFERENYRSSFIRRPGLN